MSLKIVRNDITRMNCDAVVNTASEDGTVGPGCDYAIHMAAGFERLTEYRRKNIGPVKEGKAFITPGFSLSAKYIIHAVSPLFIDGHHGEEERLRSCYRESLKLAYENSVKSIAFPIISTGSFGYPKEEGVRIAFDEISAFIKEKDIEVYLVVYDEKATAIGKTLYPELKDYLNKNYVELKMESVISCDIAPKASPRSFQSAGKSNVFGGKASAPYLSVFANKREPAKTDFHDLKDEAVSDADYCESPAMEECAVEFSHEAESKLSERMRHMKDSFSDYLMYLIQEKGMTNAEVYKRGIVDKKVFSKIKNNPDYHPQKITAMCLCVGAMLNLDETKDLLARAGYALSPCDKTDVIFSFFIENGIYDMIELDIQLEEYGEKCLIV